MAGYSTRIRGKQVKPKLPNRVSFSFYLRPDAEELAFMEGRKKELGLENDNQYFRHLMEQDYKNQLLKIGLNKNV